MALVLIISREPSSVRPIEENAIISGVKTKAVASQENAEQWLSNHDFDGFLLDDRGGYNSAKILDVAWSRNPEMLAGLFSLSGPVKSSGVVRLAGWEVYQSPHALQDIRLMFNSLLSRQSLRSNGKILVVDDLDAPRSIMCTFVGGLGFGETLAAGSVDEALKLQRKNPKEFFCVLTDINMPKLSGAELIRSVRDDKELAHLPVIVVTAHGSAENLRPSILAGASGVLVKPPRKKELAAELLRARRILANSQDPRLCRPEEPDDLPIIEEALAYRLGRIA